MKNIVSFLKKLIQLHQEMMNQVVYRIIDLEKDKCEHNVVSIQVIGKNIIFKKKPEEILADDKMLEQFHSKDIRALTYLGYLNVNMPQYKILSRKHSEKLNKMLFSLHKKGEEKKQTKTADEIALSESILNSLSPKEAYIVGYMAATEQILLEEEEKKNLK